MAKYLAFVIILALRLMYQPEAGSNRDPFASPLSSPPSPVKIISFTSSLSNGKVFLRWQVNGNEAIDQFEVEKSGDGKNFHLAGLVFGTDVPAIDSYWFYEKATRKKLYYRLKLIKKGDEIAFSPVIEVNPNA
jgi:hypothetical protein